jgi:16S rRNA C1402 (ribose-2'-O) methylase RsmI
MAADYWPDSCFDNGHYVIGTLAAAKFITTFMVLALSVAAVCDRVTRRLASHYQPHPSCHSLQSFKSREQQQQLQEGVTAIVAGGLNPNSFT